jgi:hypothetical protein
MKRQSHYQLSSINKFYELLVKNGYSTKRQFSSKTGISYDDLCHLNSRPVSHRMATQLSLLLHINIEQLFIKQN